MTWPVHLSCASFNRVCTLCIFAFFRTSVSGILSCHLIFRSFLRQLRWKWLSFLAWRWYTVQVSGWQNNSLVDFQLSIKSDSILFPDICAKSAECYAGLRSSGCYLIINVHCSGESASKIREFINNLRFLSIHSDGWFAVRLSRCLLVYYLSLFCANCELKLSHAFNMRSTAPCIFFL